MRVSLSYYKDIDGDGLYKISFIENVYIYFIMFISCLLIIVGFISMIYYIYNFINTLRVIL
jgi:hypothetical protein